MLQMNKRSSAVNRQFGEGDESGQNTLHFYIDILRRQFPTMLAIVVACLLVALLYLFTAMPQFTSTASMVIDTRKVQLFQQPSMMSDVSVDSGMVETQVEILKSENISLAVIRDLHLIEDPEFTGSGGGLIGAVADALSALVSTAQAPTEFKQTRKALERFEKKRTIRRIGLTYVMEIGFTSSDPGKAAQISNAIADAYIVDQLEAKYQASRRASVWLQDRIKELRTQASAAQKAVVDFKTTNNIVDTGGRLMNEQQLAEVNSQLILSRASTAEAKARLDRMNDIVKQEIPDASVADALKNDTIVKLRGQYVDMASKESIWSAKYGSDHLAAVNLRRQMAEIKKNIQDELKRIQESYKSDYDIALTREESIKSSLNNVVSESQLTNQAQVQLRELESNAQTYQAMYDNFLQRYMESVQQQSFPITEARVISAASTPLVKSYPKTLIILAIALIAGIVLSFGVALARETMDNVFRTTEQVDQIIGANCLAIVPLIARNNSTKLLADASKEAEGGAKPDLLRYVVDKPLSRFAEAVRSLKVAFDLSSSGRQNRVIAITSTLPNEGKSTLSINLAQLMAQGGARVILIDFDLRNPSLSRALLMDNRDGLVQVAGHVAELDNLINVDSSTGLSFLPAGLTSNLPHTNEILASQAMGDLVGQLRSKYDYVVIDMPPLAPVVDVRVTSSYVDSYLFVVEWGQTRVDVVQHKLRSLPEIQEKLLGVVLNKADTRLLARYESYHGRNYYQKYYARYGYVE
ncbi:MULTISPECIES: polysaccharide biosynthesis tyrosine autokinase [unclassified Bradyrhizobium]|uniref:polysaccharide biosynthesis tyrosine autokinase n=1 Tax=unclassified Bradyrhizobium TaxID=2631580 RepID=UPI00211E077B|nr:MULTISPECIES: polysaccharide biosynthesis tyrosine autokinase [unclassified Bradyrhizobium]MDD1532475.1 exopolysaccharide biosynthesis protein [Bradyrhizobium sp. WBOS8]MDD1582479.1 exopolysaccharide biosynthesis protein [Bradyrhizobium sp. WBOS4]UUO50875.1 exopolysaccharide biosynthesis protein [Bradyrhizobium sp. WBOS04]UUO58254.1 exopolysaccharide biosynthesis protein [Bradyrhizobium sp. WBOS08]